MAAGRLIDVAGHIVNSIAKARRRPSIAERDGEGSVIRRRFLDQVLDRDRKVHFVLLSQRWTSWTRQSPKKTFLSRAHAHHFTHITWSNWSIRVFRWSKGGPRVVHAGP